MAKWRPSRRPRRTEHNEGGVRRGGQHSALCLVCGASLAVWGPYGGRGHLRVLYSFLMKRKHIPPSSPQRQLRGLDTQNQRHTHRHTQTQTHTQTLTVNNTRTHKHTHTHTTTLYSVSFGCIIVFSLSSHGFSFFLNSVPGWTSGSSQTSRPGLPILGARRPVGQGNLYWEPADQ